MKENTNDMLDRYNLVSNCEPIHVSKIKTTMRPIFFIYWNSVKEEKK